MLKKKLEKLKFRPSAQTYTLTCCYHTNARGFLRQTYFFMALSIKIFVHDASLFCPHPHLCRYFDNFGTTYPKSSKLRGTQGEFVASSNCHITVQAQLALRLNRRQMIGDFNGGNSQKVDIGGTVGEYCFEGMGR